MPDPTTGHPDSRPAVGIRHLHALAAAPRSSGTREAATARAYCAHVLRGLGFRLTERPFEYSAAVGSYGTPLGGAVMMGLVTWAAAFALGEREISALVVLLMGMALVAIVGRWLARHGVLALPIARRTGVNLEAVRVTDTPLVWLVAHVDSKSQPVPLAVRAGGIVLLALAWIAAIVLVVAAMLGRDQRRAWPYVIAVAAAGALPVIGSVVGRNSAGAVDNASGVATVLTAAEFLGGETRVGVLITDAEELGLAGARAWCAGGTRGIALNCDGVDDVGTLTLMWTRPRSGRAERALIDSAGEPVRVIPLVPGVLVDSLAISDAGGEAITVSRGSLATLRRIHTRRDDLVHLRGEGIESTARALARAARTLMEQR